MLEHSVKELASWMNSTQVEPALVSMVREYLLAQDTKSMSQCLRGGSNILAAAAASQDKLGWDCFIEGRITKVFLEVVKPTLSKRRSRITPERWCCKLAEKLLQLTHKQWLFRNSHVHYKKLEGLTTAQHEEILERVKTLMWTEPGDLLTKHRYLLEEDFELMGEGSTGTRLQWIASIESAKKAADRIRSGLNLLGEPGSFVEPVWDSNSLKPTKDGSIVYRRCRRKRSIT